MSEHDRGAFGALMVEAKALGAVSLDFHCNLSSDTPESEATRWWASTLPLSPDGKGFGQPLVAHGRTGEEALRALVELLKVRK